MRERILKINVPWGTLKPIVDLSDNEINLIEEYDNKLSDKKAIAEKHGAILAKIFMVMLAKIQKIEHTQYILTLLDDFLKENPKQVLLFYELRSTLGEDYPFGPILTLVKRRGNDWYINARAGSILAVFLTKLPEVSEEDRSAALRWFVQQLRKDKDLELFAALTPLQTILRRNENRLAFYKEDGLEALLALVKYKSQEQNFQLLYQALFCLWLLSYHPEIRPKMNDPDMIFNLVEILKQVENVKVKRLTLATLRNLLEVKGNAENMISFGIMKPLTTLNNRKWEDEDIADDLKALTEALNEKVNELSTFDMYKNEVLSKKLDWTSPCHRSEKFWRENVTLFEEDDYLILKCLKEIISSSDTPPRVVAVACWDLGEFVRFHSRGKAILQNIGAKNAIMALLNHPNEEIQKEALLALQKLMVTKWEYLSQ
jgi:V-type H+-transporting ATPase subunit H